MPRFYLHLRTRTGLVEDTEGAVFANLEDARSEALASGKAAIVDRIKAGDRLSAILEDGIEIAGESGPVLLVVPYREAAEIDDHQP